MSKHAAPWDGQGPQDAGHDAGQDAGQDAGPPLTQALDLSSLEKVDRTVPDTHEVHEGRVVHQDHDEDQHVDHGGGHGASNGADRGATAAPFASAGAEFTPGQNGRQVTCPECGTTATIAVNRRESHDFCSNCDFPLFWTPNQLVLGDADLQAQAALRRLPGTAGRSTVGSLRCPHCAEANPVSGVLCLRCGGDLHPVAAPPPAPEPAPEPAPVPVEEPRGIPFWWLVVGCATIALVILVVVVLLQQR